MVVVGGRRERADASGKEGRDEVLARLPSFEHCSGWIGHGGRVQVIRQGKDSRGWTWWLKSTEMGYSTRLLSSLPFLPLLPPDSDMTGSKKSYLSVRAQKTTSSRRSKGSSGFASSEGSETDSDSTDERTKTRRREKHGGGGNSSGSGSESETSSEEDSDAVSSISSLQT
jgi:hypothetical protein